MNDREFVDAAYRLVLRRAADSGGSDAAEASLRRGSQSRAGLVATLVASAEFAAVRAFDDSIACARTGPQSDLRAPAGSDERHVEVPWVLSRHSGARRVLDVGYAYAPALYLEALVTLEADEIVGVDLVERSVGGLRCVVADLRELPFADRTFDLVFCVSTLEHVGWDNTVYGLEAEQDSSGMFGALGELRRIVASDGRILITVPCGVDEHHGWFVQRPPSKWLSLFEGARLRVSEYEIYELDATGWRAVEDAPKVRYGERGPGASAVLCAVLTR